MNLKSDQLRLRVSSNFYVIKNYYSSTWLTVAINYREEIVVAITNCNSCYSTHNKRLPHAVQIAIISAIYLNAVMCPQPFIKLER